MPNNKNKNLLDPANAVSSYFDTLLSEEMAAPEAKPQVDERHPVAPVLLHMPNLEADLAALERAEKQRREKPEPVQKVVVTVAETSAPEADVSSNAAETVAEPDQNRDAVQPGQEKQAQYEFPMQCLMFHVAGVDFSLPLIDMGGVLSWSDQLTRLPGGPHWFLGLLKYRERNIRVVDTARLLRLERDDRGDPGQHHIIVFGESNWAVTCDRLGDVIGLNHEDVQWKSPNRRSLSLGTIRDSLALLLDPKKMLSYLDGVELPEAGSSK